MEKLLSIGFLSVGISNGGKKGKIVLASKLSNFLLTCRMSKNEVISSFVLLLLSTKAKYLNLAQISGIMLISR